MSDPTTDPVEDLFLTPDGALVVPNGTAGRKPLCFDLRSIVKAETRLFEVQSVTRAKSAELLHTYNDAWGNARKIVATLLEHLDTAKHRIKELQSVLILDKIPELAKAKGLKETADVREALLYTQPDFLKLCETRDKIVAAERHMTVKVDQFERAYFTVQTIVKGADGHTVSDPNSPFGNTKY